MEKIEQLVATLSKEAAAKPAPHPVVLSLKWLAVTAAYLVASLAISGVRVDLLQKLHEPWFVAEIVVLLGILVSTALSAAVLSFPDMHQKRRTALAPVWMSVLFLLLMYNAWRADSPPAPLPMHGLECTLSILMLAFMPSVAIFYAVRKFASTHQRWSGSIVVLFAFSIGALWLRLYEPTDSIIHVIEWHYLPLLGFSAVGWWLGKMLLKW